MPSSSGSSRLPGLLDCADEGTTTHPLAVALLRSFDFSESGVFHSGITWPTVLLDSIFVTNWGGANNDAFCSEISLLIVNHSLY